MNFLPYSVMKNLFRAQALAATAAQLLGQEGDKYRDLEQATRMSHVESQLEMITELLEQFLNTYEDAK